MALQFFPSRRLRRPFRILLRALCVAMAAAPALAPRAEATTVAAAQQAGQPVTRPHAGLLWNRSGTPAIFPLVVKSAPGHDRYLQLSDPGTGKPVLAAYVRGGAFFKVLVPHGSFTLSFASGPGAWQGETALFGPGTRWLVLPKPLTFRVEGVGGKAGHVVDLRAGATGAAVEAGMHGQVICQRLMLDTETLHLGPLTRIPAPGAPPEEYYEAPQLYVHTHVCD